MLKKKRVCNFVIFKLFNLIFFSLLKKWKKKELWMGDNV